MSISGTIAAAITLIATEGTGIGAAIQAYAIGPALGPDALTVGSSWISDDDS